MKNEKRIFSKAVLIAALFAAGTAFASTTKVGNGDDGADLEGLTPITSGPIFDARIAAVAALKVLNVQGIAGMGFVIPEVEYTQLLMAKADVRPLSTEGEWETSEDHRAAYARTFPEPHAPTRFFPAALKLSRDQLIALHTHEALHRALPPGVRENEEKVAMLTMALTSPSATFDRVNRIAQMTMSIPDPAATTAPAKPGWIASSFAITAPMTEAPRPKTKTRTNFEYVTYTGQDAYNNYFIDRSVMKAGGEFSPLKPITAFGYATEPRFFIQGMLVRRYDPVTAGPLTFSAQLPTSYDEGKTFSPFVRVSLKSLEQDFSSKPGRDVYTVGGVFENQRPSTYSQSGLSYTLPDYFSSDKGLGAIWSYDLKAGFKKRRFGLGGVLGLHHMFGNAATESFTLLQLGPELTWSKGSLVIRLAGGLILNRGDKTKANLDDLNDLAGHGAGRGHATASVGFDL